jgi:hypothetical protein
LPALLFSVTISRRRRRPLLHCVLKKTGSFYYDRDWHAS